MIDNNNIENNSDEKTEDDEWENAFAIMHEREPLFKRLPTKDEQARKVYEQFKKQERMEPIVLVKKVDEKKFKDWLRESELGLHKSVRTEDGLVYIPQACVFDHGRLRGFFHKLAIVNDQGDRAEYLMDSFSGAQGGLNPDVAWCELNSPDKYASVVFEIGISQSLPDLRRKAYMYNSNEEYVGLEYVVLIKRYRTTYRLYIEIWKKITNGPGPANPDFNGNEQNPRELGVNGSFDKMRFFANAHAADFRRGRVDTSVDWQSRLNTSCSIPRQDIVRQYDDNGELIPRKFCLGGNVTFDAGDMVGICKWSDLG